MRSFSGVPVEYGLAKPHELLAKLSASYSGPGRESIFSLSEDVDEQAGVLHHPRDHRMVDRDEAVQALLEA